MKKRFLLICSLIIALSLIGCTTVVDYTLQKTLHYSDEEIEELIITPEEGTFLSKRAAIYADIVGSILNSGIDINDKSIDLHLGGSVSEIKRADKYEITTMDGEFDFYAVYPDRYKGKSSLPVILLCFGGGFIYGDFNSIKDFAIDLANEVNAIVVVPEYHLAPVYKFPVAHNDVYASWLWILDNADKLNADLSKTAFVGLSAGGNLVEGVTLRLLNEGLVVPNSVALLWPSLSISGNIYPSMNYFGNGGYILNFDLLEMIQKAYLEKDGDAFSMYASPLTMLEEKYGTIDTSYYSNFDISSLSNHPKTLIIAAKVDMLRDEAVSFAAHLLKYDVDIKLTVYEEMLHGFAKTRLFSKSIEARNELYKFIKQSWK